MTRPAPGRTAWFALAAALAFAAPAVAIAAHPSAPAVLAGPDQAWLRLMLHSRTPAGDATARVLNVVWAGPGFAVLCLVVLGALAVARRFLAAAYVAATIVVASRVSGVLKIVLDRPRPPVADRLFPVREMAFPSGHSVDAAALLTALVLLAVAARGQCRWRPGVTAVIVTAAVLVAAVMWSRTYAGVHWLSDTVGGALLGVFWALALWSAAGWWRRRRTPRDRPDADVDGGQGRS